MTMPTIQMLPAAQSTLATPTPSATGTGFASILAGATRGAQPGGTAQAAPEGSSGRPALGNSTDRPTSDDDGDHIAPGGSGTLPGATAADAATYGLPTFAPGAELASARGTLTAQLTTGSDDGEAGIAVDSADGSENAQGAEGAEGAEDLAGSEGDESDAPDVGARAAREGARVEASAAGNQDGRPAGITAASADGTARADQHDGATRPTAAPQAVTQTDAAQPATGQPAATDSSAAQTTASQTAAAQTAGLQAAALQPASSGTDVVPQPGTQGTPAAVAIDAVTHTAPTSEAGQTQRSAAPALAEQVRGPLLNLRAAQPGEHTLTLRIEPERLGPVQVRAHIGADGIRIELVGATDAGRDGLKAILTALRRDLAAAGMNARLDLNSGSDSGFGHEPNPSGTEDDAPRPGGAAVVANPNASAQPSAEHTTQSAQTSAANLRGGVDILA